MFLHFLVKRIESKIAVQVPIFLLFLVPPRNLLLSIEELTYNISGLTASNKKKMIASTGHISLP
jgi:hypothetical protein